VNIFLWILQILLALVFLATGLGKLTQPKDKLVKQMGWVNDFSANTVKLVGGLELLAAVGLILPWWTGIASVLTPLAALGLVAIMVGAIMTHVRRKEYPLAGANVVLLVLSAIVAIGRF
jgi:uncharacterized membrane protein YphA (DoxX/SURF4 family)